MQVTVWQKIHYLQAWQSHCIHISSAVSNFYETEIARTYLQLPLWQWGAGIVYLLVLSS